MSRDENDVNETIIKNLYSEATMDDTNNSETNSGGTRTDNGAPSENFDRYEDGPTPSKRMKVSLFDGSYIGSPREIRRLRSDLIEARNSITWLKSQITHLHAVRKNLEITFEEENAFLKKKSEYDLKSIENLESQLQNIRKREADLKKELIEANCKIDALKLKKSEEVEALNKSFADYKEKARDIEFDETNVVAPLKKRISELEIMLSAAEKNAEAQKNLAADLSKQLNAENTLKRELELKEQELQRAKLQIKEMEYAHETYLEYKDQAKSQIQKLTHYSELLKENEQLKEENVRLKDQVRNKLLLEEEVHDLKGRLTKFKDMEKKYVELQVKENQNDMLLNEWRAVTNGICESVQSDVSLPHVLRTTVDRLQRQEIILTSEKVQLESEFKNLTHEMTVTKTELEKCQQLVAELKSVDKEKQSLIHRLQKKLLLISRERDSYRLQLDSYEKDLTINISAGTTSSQDHQKERIFSLEKVIEGYRDYIAKLENDMQEIQPGLNSDGISNKGEQILNLQKEISQLKADNERLRQRCDELEIHLENYAVGQDSVRGGDVFHPTKNPLAECLAQRESLVERLEQENNRLKRKIKNMEEGIEGSRIGDVSINIQEVNALREQVKSHESQTQKLKEFFKSQMQEFRNVIYILLGYKIDRTQNSFYKLRSMYAEHEDDLLCFQVNKDGNLTLLANDYSDTLGPLIDLHLKQQNSIPVFLSTHTIELFSTKTMTMT